ncbi:MAG TPA: 2OG-Fe(II) oxygenase [Cellvibrionaceae bacterium]
MPQLNNNYPDSTQVNEDPLVVILDDFITDDECRELIKAADTELKRALVSDGRMGVLSKGRTGSNCWVKHQHNKTIARLCERISQLVGLPLVNAESLQVVHYATEQEYAAHFDAWDADTERGQRCMARGGQRLLTCLMYLNTVSEGGGTGFPTLDVEVAAIKGRMVIFHNCHAGTNLRHPASLHGGLPVTSGEKWACNLWFRESPYQAVSQASAKKTSFKRRF